MSKRKDGQVGGKYTLELKLEAVRLVKGRHMQFVLQSPYLSLHPRMTVACILTEPLLVHQTVAPAHPYTLSLLDAVPIPDPARQRAGLAVAPPEPEFDQQRNPPGRCAFGEDHGRTGASTWHRLGPGHGVSCRLWPAGVVS